MITKREDLATDTVLALPTSSERDADILRRDRQSLDFIGSDLHQYADDVFTLSNNLAECDFGKFEEIIESLEWALRGLQEIYDQTPERSEGGGGMNKKTKLPTLPTPRQQAGLLNLTEIAAALGVAWDSARKSLPPPRHRFRHGRRLWYSAADLAEFKKLLVKEVE